MREIINKYEINEQVTPAKLLGANFKMQKPTEERPYVMFSYVEELIDEIEVQIEIDIYRLSEHPFDDTKNIKIYDAYNECDFAPFYDEDRDYDFLNDLIKEYNTTMDSLVKKGIFKPKKINKPKKLINEM